MLKDKLGIQHNIIQGAMAQITMGEFAALVSKQGGLGVIAAGGIDKDRLQTEIAIAKAITDKPIGVNLMLMNQNIQELIDIIIAQGIKVVTYGGGDISPYIDQLRANNIECIALVGSVKQAVEEEAKGATLIVAEGSEAGGHIGEIGTMSLIPQVVDAVSIPVIAAGGIADTRGVLAAHALGAIGVQIGTRLIASNEIQLPSSYKETLINSDDQSTVVTGRKFNTPVRVYRNKMAKDYLEMEYSDSEFKDLEHITKGSLRKSVVDGDMDNGSVMFGQISGLIKSIESLEDIFKDLTK